MVSVGGFLIVFAIGWILRSVIQNYHSLLNHLLGKSDNLRVQCGKEFQLSEQSSFP
jgi:hypothetical protein